VEQDQICDGHRPLNWKNGSATSWVLKKVPICEHPSLMLITKLSSYDYIGEQKRFGNSGNKSS
jgi:hypothetical protein